MALAGTASSLLWPPCQVDVQRTFVHFASPSIHSEGEVRRSTSCDAGHRASSTPGSTDSNFEVSVGSALHLSGGCKPCAWRWRPGGCTNGRHCRYCHLCEEGAVKRRKREKLIAARLASAGDDASRQAKPKVVIPKIPSEESAQAPAYVGIPWSPTTGQEPLIVTLGLDALMCEAVRRAKKTALGDGRGGGVLCTPSTSSGSSPSASQTSSQCSGSPSASGRHTGRPRPSRASNGSSAPRTAREVRA